jgi:hypothetical protein
VFDLPQIGALAAEKRIRLAESEIRRRTVALEWTRVVQSVAWVDRGVQIAQRTPPVLLAAVPVLGFLAARQFKRLKPLISGGSLVWGILRRFL